MKVKAITLRIIRQFIRDKRTLMLMLLAPILLLSLMYVVFSGNGASPKIGLVNVPDMIKLQLVKENVTLDKESNREKLYEKLKESKIDAILEFEGNSVTLTLEGSDPSKNRAVLAILQSTVAKIQQGPIKIDFSNVKYVYGSSEISQFDYIGPVLIGYFIFFFVFLIAGVSFLRERTQGTLERMLATPLQRWEIVVGYISGFGLFTTLQTVLIVFYSIEVLKINMVGSIWFVLLVTVLLAMSALTLGTFISAYANNELQMIQFIPIVIVPQIFFSGLFNLESLAEWVQNIGVIMPMTYGANALREVMIKGSGWDKIATDIYVLAAFSLSFMFLNILALRKHRKI